MTIIKNGLKTFLILILSFTFISAVNVNDGKYFDISKQIEIFANLYKEINTSYVDDLDPAKLMRTGIDAMLESLDPYTNYISESEIEGYRMITEGKFNGVGALFKKMGDYVVITQTHENSPALKAGLKAGDIIMSVDGNSAKDRNEYEINEILKGFPGTEIDLMIKRPGTSKNQKITIVREEVNVPNVPYSGMLSDDVGYVALTTFTRKAGQNVGNAFRELKKDNPNLKGVILDLRNNGGGLLNEAVNIANIFLPKGEMVVTTKGKVVDWDRSFKTMNKAIDLDIPVAVMINNNSASASEIVCGVLQDYDRGVLIGQQSYGKGLVQNTRDIGYNSKVKLTTAKYYIPSGRCIQGVEYENGIPVDIPDEMRTPFKTRNGRKVLDGGGVRPDVILEAEKFPTILKNLDQQHLLFDYVTEYTLKHPTIADAKAFNFTDYDGFVTFVKNNRFKHRSKAEEKLAKLKDVIDKEEYTSDVKTEYEALSRKLQAAREKDLIKHKDLISKIIEGEIVSRYYLQRGKIEHRLDRDSEIREAINILKDKERYNKILKN